MKSAKNVLDAHWDGKLPVNVKALARALGAQVKSDPFLSESGRIDMINGSPVITYSGIEATVRQRFTIAHEIGHLALGHLSNGETHFRDPASNFSSGAASPVERAANNFAAQLLMPADVIKYAISKQGLKKVESLASAFGVSQVAMKWRLVNLGIIPS